MSYKLNLKTKIKLDNLLKKLLSTIRDKPGRSRLDKGLERKSITRIRESLDLFVALLDFQPVSFGGLTHNLHIYAGIKSNGGNAHTFEPVILFDEKSLYLGMKKGPFILRMDSDLAWLIKHDMKKEQVDLEGIDVFKFLAELALAKQQGIAAPMGIT